jgi:hypothetical protein
VIDITPEPAATSRRKPTVVDEIRAAAAEPEPVADEPPFDTDQTPRRRRRTL